MDPDECHRRITELANGILSPVGQESSDDAEELAQTWEFLNQWLKRGGALPSAWAGARV